jgi:hypothetical protein
VETNSSEHLFRGRWPYQPICARAWARDSDRRRLSPKFAKVKLSLSVVKASLQARNAIQRAPAKLGSVSPTASYAARTAQYLRCPNSRTASCARCLSYPPLQLSGCDDLSNSHNIKLAANSRRDPTQSGRTYAESASAAIESEKRARAVPQNSYPAIAELVVFLSLCGFRHDYRAIHPY